MNANLNAHPSRSSSLRNLESKLHLWLSENPGWAGPRLTLALDVVRVELACIEAFDNSELPPLSIEEAGALGADSKLTLQPYLQLLRWSYPADNLILDLHQHQKSESTEAGSRKDDLFIQRVKPLRSRKQTTCLAIHRADLSLYYMRITRPEYHTLVALQNGLTLAEALDEGFTGSRNSPMRRVALVHAWFTNWSELGWICRTAPIGKIAEG